MRINEFYEAVESRIELKSRLREADCMCETQNLAVTGLLDSLISEVEGAAIGHVLRQECGGIGRTAIVLGISRTTLRTKMRLHGITAEAAK